MNGTAVRYRTFHEQIQYVLKALEMESKLRIQAQAQASQLAQEFPASTVTAIKSTGAVESLKHIAIRLLQSDGGVDGKSARFR